MAQNGSNKFTDKRGSFINDVTLKKETGNRERKLEGIFARKTG
jgi:hypothetical protein